MSTNPSPARLAELTREATIDQIQGPLPAVIVSYDRETRRAVVDLPLRVPVRDTVSGDLVFESLGQVEDVPVCHLVGGAGSLTFDLLPGDTGLLIVLAQSPGAWLTSAPGTADVIPALTERFTLNGVAFLPGLSAFTRTLPAAAGRWLFDAPLFQFGAAATEALARADKVAARLSALEQKYDRHFHAVTVVPATGVGNTAPGPFLPIDQVIIPTTAADVACDKVIAE